MLHIQEYILKENQYFLNKVKKTTIVLHHTASSYHSRRVIDSWNQNQDRIGTSYVIGGLPSDAKKDTSQNGVITCAFHPDYWAYHLGVNVTPSLNVQLNSQAIGIEICNWGFLTLAKNGDFINYVGQVIPTDQVHELPIPFRGFKYYHKYTKEQLESTKNLIELLSKTYNIPINKKWNLGSFELSPEAMSGKEGLWLHTNYRKDKTDLSPQKEVLDMLNSL